MVAVAYAREVPNLISVGIFFLLFWIGGLGSGRLREVVALEGSTVNVYLFAQTSKDEKKRFIGFELSFDQSCLDYNGLSLTYFLFSHYLSLIQVPTP